MKTQNPNRIAPLAVATLAAFLAGVVLAQSVTPAPTPAARPAAKPAPTPGAPVASNTIPPTDFAAVMQKMVAEKPAIMQKAKQLLADRYDLSDRPAKGVQMSRGKAVQEGPRTKLPRA